MKEFWKKWRRAILFTAVGAAVGLVYYALAGCPTGSCAITANPWNTMSIRGLSDCFFPAAWEAAAAGAAAAANRPNDRIRERHAAGVPLRKQR